MEQDLGELKTMAGVIHAELQSGQKLLSQRADYLEQRLLKLEPEPKEEAVTGSKVKRTRLKVS